jgi:hypothetical protein
VLELANPARNRPLGICLLYKNAVDDPGIDRIGNRFVIIAAIDRQPRSFGRGSKHVELISAARILERRPGSPIPDLR